MKRRQDKITAVVVDVKRDAREYGGTDKVTATISFTSDVWLRVGDKITLDKITPGIGEAR